MHREEIEATAIKLNSALNRFELAIDQEIAFISFEKRENTFVLTHTEIPLSCRGQGIGGILVKKVYQYLSDNEQKGLPFCPYIINYINKHPELKNE